MWSFRNLHNLIFILFLLFLLVGCSGSQGRVVVPLTPDHALEEDPLPLRVAWVKTLLDQQNRDTWRPMQYSTPTVADGVVYMGNTSGMFHAVDALNGDILWKFKAAGPIECGALAVGKAVVFGDGDGRVYCLNRENGLVKWKYHVQGQVMGQIITDGKLVFVRTNHERLYAITLDEGKWKWMQSRELPADFTIRGVSSPVLVDGRIIFGFADGYLMGFKADTGVEVFKTLLQKGERFTDIDATPLVDGEWIYVASYGGTFYCLDRENAAIQWTYRYGSVQRAAIAGDTIFLSDDRGFLHALNKANGQLKWRFDLREYDRENSLARGQRRQLKIPTVPLPFGNVVLVASSSGYIYALDQQGGKIKWRYWPGHGVTASMTKDERNAVYVHSNFGNLYCLLPRHFYR